MAADVAGDNGLAERCTRVTGRVHSELRVRQGGLLLLHHGLKGIGLGPASQRMLSRHPQQTRPKLETTASEGCTACCFPGRVFEAASVHEESTTLPMVRKHIFG